MRGRRDANRVAIQFTRQRVGADVNRHWLVAVGVTGDMSGQGGRALPRKRRRAQPRRDVPEALKVSPLHPCKQVEGPWGGQRQRAPNGPRDRRHASREPHGALVHVHVAVHASRVPERPGDIVARHRAIDVQRRDRSRDPASDPAPARRTPSLRHLVQPRGHAAHVSREPEVGASTVERHLALRLDHRADQCRGQFVERRAPTVEHRFGAQRAFAEAVHADLPGVQHRGGVRISKLARDVDRRRDVALQSVHRRAHRLGCLHELQCPQDVPGGNGSLDPALHRRRAEPRAVNHPGQPACEWRPVAESLIEIQHPPRARHLQRRAAAQRQRLCREPLASWRRPLASWRRPLALWRRPPCRRIVPPCLHIRSDLHRGKSPLVPCERRLPVEPRRDRYRRRHVEHAQESAKIDAAPLGAGAGPVAAEAERCGARQPPAGRLDGGRRQGNRPLVHGSLCRSRRHGDAANGWPFRRGIEREHEV